MTLLLICLFGALGCTVRYLGEYSVRRHHPTNRPWATVAANAVGCGVAGYAAYRLVGTADVHLRDVVLTGFCGGLTTFSSAFAIPSILQREHHLGFSLALIITTPLACAGLFTLGVALAH
jgi:CrcB protein